MQISILPIQILPNPILSISSCCISTYRILLMQISILPIHILPNPILSISSCCISTYGILLMQISILPIHILPNPILSRSHLVAFQLTESYSCRSPFCLSAYCQTPSYPILNYSLLHQSTFIILFHFVIFENIPYSVRL